MTPHTEVVIGLDMGTGGARAVAVTAGGEVVSSASHITPTPFMDSQGVSEQVADSWKIAAMASLGRCVAGLRDKGISADGIQAICVDGTSGSIVLLDENNRPLYPGLMHNDTRSVEEAAHLNQLLAGHCEEVGYQFGPTFSLCKLLWMKAHQVPIFRRTRRVLHHADFVVATLTGNYEVSDSSNSLKTGYNLVRQSWPSEMAELGVAELLPTVLPPGSDLGPVLPQVAEDLGIPDTTQVVAGVTDSTAAFLATGATLPGEFAVSLGTTLAFKGISENLVRDPNGVVYCHRHPAGHWLPGGASNVGGACLRAMASGKNLARLDQAAMERFPKRLLSYPLVEVGERFPFNAPTAKGFFDEVKDEVDLHVMLVQGVAFVERWCLERFTSLGIPPKAPLYTAGSGSRSDVWNRIRANISQIPLARSRSTDAAFGAAVLAAAKVFHGGNLEAAGKAMTGIDAIFEPDPAYADWAAESLAEIKRRCHERGWGER